MLLKKIQLLLVSISICSLINCATSSEYKKETTKRKKRKARVSAVQSPRTVAGNKETLFFEESGLDFLSKKLEDTISGYEGLKEKLLSLEEKLSHLIFLIEGKTLSAVAQDNEDSLFNEEIDEESEREERDEELIKSKEIVPKKKQMEESIPEQRNPSNFSKENMASGGN